MWRFYRFIYNWEDSEEFITTQFFCMTRLVCRQQRRCSPEVKSCGWSSLSAGSNSFASAFLQSTQQNESVEHFIVFNGAPNGTITSTSKEEFRTLATVTPARSAESNTAVSPNSAVRTSPWVFNLKESLNSPSSVGERGAAGGGCAPVGYLTFPAAWIRGLDERSNWTSRPLH